MKKLILIITTIIFFSCSSKQENVAQEEVKQEKEINYDRVDSIVKAYCDTSDAINKKRIKTIDSLKNVLKNR